MSQSRLWPLRTKNRSSFLLWIRRLHHEAERDPSPSVDESVVNVVVAFASICTPRPRAHVNDLPLSQFVQVGRQEPSKGAARPRPPDRRSGRGHLGRARMATTSVGDGHHEQGEVEQARLMESG
jgi:hypothetical protein